LIPRSWLVPRLAELARSVRPTVERLTSADSATTAATAAAMMKTYCPTTWLPPMSTENPETQAGMVWACGVMTCSISGADSAAKMIVASRTM
jgi:hypothetical protein